MPPTRITLSRRKGWRMPPNTVKVCRPGKWGNPFKPLDPTDFSQVCRSVHYFERWLTKVDEHGFDCGPGTGVSMQRLPHSSESRELSKQLSELSGKNLACWCKAGMPCHADVLLRLANKQSTAVKL